MTQPEMFPNAVRRPSINDEDVLASAINAMLADIREWLPTMRDGEDEEAREILGDSMSENGFEIAKEFDRRGWEVDAELVSILDCARSALVSALNRAVRAWVEATSPKPMLALGAAVITPDEKSLAGEIARIDEREATYLVCVPSLGHVREGMGTHGFIYAWEVLEAANASVSNITASS